MSVPVSQRARPLLDSEYYTYTQPPQPRDAASQLGVTQPPQPSQQSRPPSAEEYVASTEHLYESQAPSPVSEFSIVRTGAGNIYVYSPSGGWQKLEYKPDTNTFSLSPASLPDITAEINKLGGTGYKLDPRLAEKLAKEEPSTLMFYGVEHAVKYAKLKELFPELRGKENIPEADVWHAIRARLEKRGLDASYETLAALTRAVFENPDVWKQVEADIDRQLAEAQKKQEELQRFYEAKALKQWDAVRLAEAGRQYEQFYRSASEATPAWAVPLSSFINNMARFLSFGLVNPPPTGYEALLARYEQLASKAPAPGMMLPSARIREGLSQGVYTPTEQAEIKAIEKNLEPGKTLLYTAGYTAAFFAAGKVLGKAVESLPRVADFLKWEFSEGLAGRALRKAGIEPKMPQFVTSVSERVKPKLLSIGEKVGLVEREQLVPKTVDAWYERLSSGSLSPEGSVTQWRFAARVREWGRAEELLGGRVPESMRLGERELTVLPLEGGKRVPFAGPGSVYSVEVRDFTLFKGGSAPSKAFGFYAVGTREGDSLVTATRVTLGQPEPSLPHAVLEKIVGARVDYAKLLEQARGGLPSSVLLTEEGDILARLSRTPKIPVKEVFTPTGIPKLPPLILPPKLPVKEEEREGKMPETRVPPKIPVDVRATPPDISIKPFSIPSSSVRPFQAFKPEVAEFTAPKTGEFSIQLPRVEPRAAEVAAPKLRLPEAQLPKLEPKVEPRIEPRAVPKTEPPLPKLPAPPLPAFGSVRDVPVPRAPRLFGSREWLVRWFGPGAPEVITAGRTRKTSRRRGGRR